MKYLTASVVFKKAIILALVVGVTGCKTSSKTRTKPVANNNKAVQNQPPVVSGQAPAGGSTTMSEMEASQKKMEAAAAEARKKAEADKKAKEDAAAAEALKNASAGRASEVAVDEDKKAKEAKEAAEKAELAKKEKEEADKKLKAEVDKKAQEEAAKKAQADKVVADQVAAAQSKAKEEKKESESKPTVASANLTDGELEVATDEANVLKDKTCSLVVEKTEQSAALRMSIGGQSIAIDVDPSWLGDKESVFSKDALDKIDGKRIAVGKAKPATSMVMSVTTKKELNLVAIGRTYFIILDKAALEGFKDLKEITEFAQANSNKVAEDSAYKGMTLSLDSLTVQVNEKGSPIGFSYTFQEIVNGTTVVTDGKPTYKTKNNLKVRCRSAAAVAANAAAK